MDKCWGQESITTDLELTLALSSSSLAFNISSSHTDSIDFAELITVCLDLLLGVCLCFLLTEAFL